MAKPIKICKVEGCLQKHHARGFCNKHYKSRYWDMVRIRPNGWRSSRVSSSYVGSNAEGRGNLGSCLGLRGG